MNLDCIHAKKISEKSPKINARSFYFLITCVIAVSLVHTSYAQLDSEGQITLSDNLLNDPIAQDILKKIEQTKKMIAELEEKEFEQNQAQENLQNMRDLSVQHLNQDLEEWERLWEKHSSRNAFDSFVSKKPSYVHGVFWDQFEFKEKKVNAGRVAMNQVLTSGGTILDAKNAYHKAASTQRIELIEMNSQFNVKHNLAVYAEQQIFNSTGQMHMSPVSEAKLANFYSDYRLQPSYILANSVYSNSVDTSVDTKCGDGLILVSRVTSGNFACVEQDIAKKWISDGIKGIVIVSEPLIPSNVITNPGTECSDGNQVVYIIAVSEYQCVSESGAKYMIENNTAKNHTLVDYILGKDKLKVYEDEIFDVNKEIQRITGEFDLKNKNLELEYKKDIEDENEFAKQEMQKIIKEYKKGNDTGAFTKEYVTSMISEIRDSNERNKEKLLDEQLDAINRLEVNLKDALLKAIRGYERNPDVNVDWNYLLGVLPTIEEKNIIVNKTTAGIEQVSFSKQDEIYMDNVGIINSFGQKFDEIKQNQILQIAADITNPKENREDFVYSVEIRDKDNTLIQPAKWMTGTLNPDQTLNVSLSWIPKEIGEFNAKVTLGEEMDSILQIVEVKINVNLEVDVRNVGYCKEGYELLFKYSDNSPICASFDTASKLINIGLAFD
jgi:hypothetical protein